MKHFAVSCQTIPVSRSIHILEVFFINIFDASVRLHCFIIPDHFLWLKTTRHSNVPRRLHTRDEFEKAVIKLFGADSTVLHVELRRDALRLMALNAMPPTVNRHVRIWYKEETTTTTMKRLLRCKYHQNLDDFPCAMEKGFRLKTWLMLKYSLAVPDRIFCLDCKEGVYLNEVLDYRRIDAETQTD